MALTHDDVYKALPGYQVMVSHFHLNEELTDAGTIDHEPAWIPTFKALGINIAGSAISTPIRIPPTQGRFVSTNSAFTSRAANGSRTAIS
jgi:hypothetical protein